MTIQDIRNAAEEIRQLLIPKICPNVERLEELNKLYGRVPAIKQMFLDDYDRRAIHPGWGAPNCSCHINPPCEACVAFTNAQGEP